MKYVYFKTEDLGNVIQEFYKGKDLVTLDEIIDDFDNFIYQENERKRQELEDERDRNYGISEYDDFIYESQAGK